MNFPREILHLKNPKHFWTIALVAGLLSGLLLTTELNRSPWLICVPIIAGSLAVVISEFLLPGAHTDVAPEVDQAPGGALDLLR